MHGRRFPSDENGDGPRKEKGSGSSHLDDVAGASYYTGFDTIAWEEYDCEDDCDCFSDISHFALLSDLDDKADLERHDEDNVTTKALMYYIGDAIGDNETKDDDVYDID